MRDLKALDFYILVTLAAAIVAAIFYRKEYNAEHVKTLKLELENTQLKERLNFYESPVL